MMLPAISIMQPWAWLILRPDVTDPEERKRLYETGLIKDIENRDWATRHRGRILVHTGKTYSPARHEEMKSSLRDDFGIKLPAFDAMPLAGIVGAVDIKDVVTESRSRWFTGEGYGYELANAEPLPYRRYRGLPGLFWVPAVEQA